MSRFKTARRRAMLTLLATLLSGPAVVAGATSASADPACGGGIDVTTYSRNRAYVGIIYRHRPTEAITRGERRRGNEADPIVSYHIPLDRPFQVKYYDLRNSKHLRTDTLDYGGTFNINPCHRGVVTIR